LKRLEVPNLSRLLVSCAALVLILLAVQAFWLGKNVQQRLEALSSAATDNLQWTLSQAEVDFLKYQRAAMQVQGRADLPRLRRQFDIYYSRITTFRESSSYAGIRDSEEGNSVLEGLRQGLNEQAVLIDSTDDVLLAQLDDLRQLIRGEGDDVRDLALMGVVLQATAAGEERGQLHQLFRRLAVVVITLTFALTTTALLILFLYRRGQRLAHLQAEEAARTEAMVTSSLDAILMADAEGRITALNGAAERIFEYDAAEALGRPIQTLVDIDPTLIAQASLPAETGEGDGRIQLTAYRKSGEALPVEVSLTVSRSGGNPVLVSYVRDISNRLKAEEELRRARDDALAGEQAKDKLLTVMSHEMRTPLTGILGSLDILEDLTPSPDQAKYLQAMRVSGELLLHHVNAVLELSRLEAGAEPEEERVFDLEELVTGIVDSQQANAGQGRNEISVFCNLGALTTVRGRARSLQQVLLNLVGNALKFTRDGAVSVDVLRGEDGLVEFSVADTGKGIAPEDLVRIFDDFIMLDPSYKRGSEGTGLGLAISQRLVRLMGGEITCDSELGEGSTFSFTLKMPPARMAPPAVEAGGAAPSRSAKLLIIEDNSINRLLLQKMLGDLGHVVVAASGGAEGISLIRSQQFDLILSDISMPDVDGMEVLRRVREGKLADGVEIVALTAHAAAEDHARILQAGFAEVLTKPVNRAALADLVSRRGGGPVARPEQGQGDSDIAEFIQAVGPEKARHFLAEFRSDMRSLHEVLDQSNELTDGHRQEAHRLAGSAAVLGLADLRASMLAIEQANTNAMPELEGLRQAWATADGLLNRYVGG